MDRADRVPVVPTAGATAVASEANASRTMAGDSGAAADTVIAADIHPAGDTSTAGDTARLAERPTSEPPQVSRPAPRTVPRADARPGRPAMRDAFPQGGPGEPRPHVIINIARVEVRTPPKPSATATPRLEREHRSSSDRETRPLSLDDYLARRAEERP